MELRQLEFFVTAKECGSLGKAATKLYTSQPNVSKTIKLLEEELGEPLFVRTSRGLRLTDYGKTIYKYAKDTIQNIQLIKSCSGKLEKKKFCISTYPSNNLSSLLASRIDSNPELLVEYRQGTVEEIVSHVANNISEIGVLYISKKKQQSFLNMISPKKIEFTELARRPSCVYLGPGSAYYDRTSISLSEVTNMRFINELDDFFSMHIGRELLHFGTINPEIIHNTVRTNSDHLTRNLLSCTDLAYLGISLDLLPYPNQMDHIHKLCIEEEETELLLGYIYEKERFLSDEAELFIQSLQNLLNP